MVAVYDRPTILTKAKPSKDGDAKSPVYWALAPYDGGTAGIQSLSMDCLRLLQVTNCVRERRSK